MSDPKSEFATAAAPTLSSALTIEANGINIIDESERKGHPRSLFWPWCAANISVLAIGYGAWLLGFGISFWQATIAGLVGLIISFLLCGFVALAGKRGSAPTMVESRAAFGINGNKLPGVLSWLLLVGWETVLAALAVLATATVFRQLGWGDDIIMSILAFAVVAVIVIGAGILGFDAIMKVQQYITIATIVLTLGYIVLTASHIDLDTVMGIESGPFQAMLGATIMAFTGFGLGWINSAADYSRYLPRSASSVGVVAWTTIGASVAPIVLVIWGLLLAGSDPNLASMIDQDPIGALATIVPTWYLIPFAIVAVLGLAAGAVLDIYSSGLTLLSLGVRIPRWVGAMIDGIIMAIGTVYIVFFASDFIGPFQGFLYILGVPVAAWAGVMLADVALRRKPYSDLELFDPKGRYGSVHWPAVGLVVLGTGVGWGFITNTMEVDWLAWQGYLFGMLGGKEGDWAYSNIGILFAILIGFGGWMLLGRKTVRSQEAIPLDDSDAAAASPSDAGA